MKRIRTPTHVLAALRELISALDSRVPHVERPGEVGIARDALLLRREAVARIEALENASCAQEGAEEIPSGGNPNGLAEPGCRPPPEPGSV
jgi:hypothetical protein